MSAVQRCLDRQDITDILHLRVRATNRADPELAHACYHLGAIERHGEFEGFAADFIDRHSHSRPSAESPVKGSFHLITNVLIDFQSDDRARVESYHVCWRLTDGEDTAIGGRYLDTFERRGGRWAIARRVVVFDWSRVEPSTPKFWEKHPAPPELFGQRGPQDPLYRYVARGAK
jgi:hypothetical protein